MTTLCQVMPIDWLEAISQVRYRRAWPLVRLLLTPVAFAAGALGAWRFGVDASWTRVFFNTDGLLPHWQVWCAFTISAQAAAYMLIRDDPGSVRVAA